MKTAQQILALCMDKNWSFSMPRDSKTIYVTVVVGGSVIDYSICEFQQEWKLRRLTEAADLTYLGLSVDEVKAYLDKYPY